MKFEKFWKMLTSKLSSSKELTTIKQKKNFKAKFSGGIIYITPHSTETERPSNRKEFLRVWNFAKKLAKHEQYKRGNYNEVTRNGSYILALMKHILGESDIE